MKRKLLSLFMAAVTACYALPIHTYAVNDYKVSDAESQRGVSEPSDMRNYRITPDGEEVYQTQMISLDGSVLPEEADTQADGINTDFPDDMEKPEVIHIDEKIDVDFEIKPSAINLFSMEKDLFDCGTDYAYNDFAKRSNPEGRQAFYNKLLEVNRAFASDTQDVPETTNGYIISEADISSYNLAENEIVEVYFMFKADHPEYYWLSNTITMAGGLEKFYVPVYSDYARGEVRSALKTTMTESIKKYAALADGYTSNYEIALILHDAIIDDVEYGYNEDGTPLDTAYAHGIVGVLDGDTETDVVCEAYARTYQLLLNYLGVENVFIVGYAGEDHAWNAVKFEDENWYLIDLTWDDQPLMPKGCIYDYFATDSSKWANRTANTSSQIGIAFQYDLPEISAAEYVPSDFTGESVGAMFNGEHQGVGDYSFTVSVNNFKRKEVFVSRINRLYWQNFSYKIPEKVTYNNIAYTVTGIEDSSWETWDTPAPEELYLPDSIEYIGRMVGDNLEKINIPRNVRYFETNLFSNLNNIELDIENPNFIMEDGVLYSADKEKLYIRTRNETVPSFIVPDSVKQISDYALACNKYLTDVTLSENLTELPDSLFFNCESLTGTLTIPDNVTEIGGQLIMGTAITSVHLPLNLKNFWHNSLKCDFLEEISISPENVKGYSCLDGVLYRDGMICIYPNNKKEETYYIQNGTSDSMAFLFENSKNLKTVYVPDSYQNTEQIKNMFDESSVSNIVIDADNPVMTSEDGIVFSKDMKTILRVPTYKDISVYTIPENIECISGYSFKNVKLLNELTFSSNVKEVSFGGFYGCENLKKVTFNEGLQSIESGAFMYTALENVALPDTVTSIGTSLTGAFQGCENLKEIKLSENLNEIPRQAFAGCSNLNKITIPKNVKKTGYSSFDDSLSEIIFNGNCPDLYDDFSGIVYYYEGHTGFENNSNLKYANLCKLKQGETPETIVNSKADALEYLEYETKPDGTIEITGCNNGVYGILQIPETINGVSVTSIGDDALSKCRVLYGLEIPSTVSEIGAYAFSNCINLTSVAIPDGVEIINEGAFKGCQGLTNINIPKSITDIRGRAFSRCGKLSITVDNGNSEYSSTDGVLFNKDKTTLIEYSKDKISPEYVIPDSVTRIWSNAFSDCNNLTTIKLPDGIKSISYGAFYYCSKLTDIEIPNSVRSIDTLAFCTCDGLTRINIPDGVTNIGRCAFLNCSSLTDIKIPNSVTAIGEEAFAFCSVLSEITIPYQVVNIGSRAFYTGSKNFVMKGYTGSKAEEYAKTNSITFESVGTIPTTSPSPSPTASATPTPTATPTASPTPTASATPTASPTPTASATPTASPSPTPTVTDEPIKEVAPIGKYADKIEITKRLDGEKAVFTITPTDNSEIPSVTLYIAEYANDGTLTGLKLGDCVKTGNTVTITADLPKTDNYKFMLWDGEQCPIIKAITDIYN